MTDNIVLFTGGFDPIHSGHLSCIKDATSLGRVIIGLNSDEWLSRKKGKSFMLFNERKLILEQLKGVLCVVGFDDSDNTASDAINKVKKMFPNNKIIFVNGGDRTMSNIPEIQHFKNCPQVSFQFGIGGNTKQNSSSSLLSSWKYQTEKRIWGDSLTYYSTEEAKIKRLIIMPGKSISMQYHNHRNEFWFVESGSGTIYTFKDGSNVKIKDVKKFDNFHVSAGEWHKLEAHSNTILSIIEIQYGNTCNEKDIVRL